MRALVRGGGGAGGAWLCLVVAWWFLVVLVVVPGGAGGGCVVVWVGGLGACVSLLHDLACLILQVQAVFFAYFP